MKTFLQYLAEQSAHHYVGNCVNSFDENGDNCTRGLPYRDSSHFASAEEDAEQESKEDFLKHVSVHPELHKILNSKHTTFLHDKDNDVHMMYDEKKDVHHFFTK